MNKIFFYSLLAIVPMMGLAPAIPAAAYEETLTLPKVKGVVRAVDIAIQRIRLKHEDIPNLGMPGMTMAFYVSDPAMIQEVVAGDRVLFSAEEPNGNLTIVWLEKQ